jgi:hypothetical protein
VAPVLRGFFVTVAVVAATVSVSPVAYAAADTLLSQGKPATASSEAGPGRVAGDAVDGDPATAWHSRGGAV